jgi:hypothetical protein
MVHKSVPGLIGAAVLAVLAAVAFSATTHGFHTTRVATSSSTYSSTQDLLASGSVTIIKVRVTHHPHPARAAILLACALAVLVWTVWHAQRSQAKDAS